MARATKARSKATAADVATADQTHASNSIDRGGQTVTNPPSDDVLPRDDLTIRLSRADIANALPFEAPDLSALPAVARADAAFKLAGRYSAESRKEEATARKHAGTALTCRTAGLITIVLSARDGEIAPSVEESLREKGWTVQSGKVFKATVCAVDELNPADPRQGSLADQRASACDTIKRIIEQKEAELGCRFELRHADLEQLVELVKNHGTPTELGASENRDNVTVPPDRSIEIALDSGKLKARELLLARTQLAVRTVPDGPMRPDEIVFDEGVYVRAMNVPGERGFVRLDAKPGDMDVQLRRAARAEPCSQFLADLFRLDRDCIPARREDVSTTPGLERSGDQDGMRLGRSQLHVLSGRTFVHSPILQDMSLIVEGVPNETIGHAIVPAGFEDDYWVHAKELREFAEQLIGKRRELAFGFHCHQREEWEPGKWLLRWTLDCDCGKDAATIRRSVVLSEARPRPGRMPLDVKRAEFREHLARGEVVQVHIDKEVFAKHSSGDARDFVKQGKNDPAALMLKLSSDRLVLDPHDLKLELKLRKRLAREEVFARALRTDWGRACVAFGKLCDRMVDDALLELDPAGVLRLSARTTEGQFAVWMFLLRARGDERTDTMLQSEMLVGIPPGD